MIQFNLLPDVKKTYIKAKRQKRLILSISVISIIASLSIVAFLFLIVQVVQKKSINDLTNDINKEISGIQSVEGLDQILTVQNQLRAIPQLHDGKQISSRIFNYLTVLTPQDVKISSLNINFADNTMVIEGTAPSLASVNQFADTLKFATYSTENIAEGEPFTSVITESTRSEDKISYSITLVFDPVLFKVTENVQLIVPNQITTRSTVNKPDPNNLNLFEDSSGE